MPTRSVDAIADDRMLAFLRAARRGGERGARLSRGRIARELGVGVGQARLIALRAAEYGLVEVSSRPSEDTGRPENYYVVTPAGQMMLRVADEAGAGGAGQAPCE